MAAVVRTPPTVRLALRSDRSDGMPSLVSRFGREVRAAPRPQAPTPHAELVEVAIDHRRRIQRSEEHTSELQSHVNLVCRLLLEKKKTIYISSQVQSVTKSTSGMASK